MTNKVQFVQYIAPCWWGMFCDWSLKIRFFVWAKHLFIYIMWCKREMSDLTLLCRLWNSSYTWWHHQMETFPTLLALTKACDVELWYFLWSEPQQMDEQTMETLVVWDAHYDITVMHLSLSTGVLSNAHWINFVRRDLLPISSKPIVVPMIASNIENDKSLLTTTLLHLKWQACVTSLAWNFVCILFLSNK